MASLRETYPGALSVGCPRMTSGSTSPLSSVASVEEDVPPNWPVNLAGLSAALPGNTLEAEDPPPAAACEATPAVVAAPVIGTRRHR
jgi:hypothetical protein